MQKQVSYLGYSERGIFNSIIYYLLSHPEFMTDFLKSIGITDEVCLSSNSTFTILGEQSFSDFGDSDMVIIAKNDFKKIVIFFEGKVKTYQGKFSLNTNFENLKNAKEINGFSSNLFVQLYYKFLLTEVLKQTKSDDTAQLNINKFFKKGKDKENRKIGNNGIVKRACEKLKSDEYYYVAIIPKAAEPDTFIKKYEGLNRTVLKDMPMPLKTTKCISWENIKELFEKRENNNIVTENFNYNYNETENKGQIY